MPALRNTRAIFALLLIGALVAPVAFADDTEEVEATGQAAIMNADKAQARDKAVDDALRKAVESAVGTMVSAETLTENYQLISDRIYSKADGYVKKYKIASEKDEDNVYIVEIKAQVATGAISADVEGLKALMRRKGMPKLIVLVAEQNIGMRNPHYWWGPGGGVMSVDMRVVETTLMEKMKEKGFTFVDPEILSKQKATVKMPVAYLSDKQARRVAKTSDAQVIIVGKALAQDIGSTWEGTKLRSASAEISVRAINTDNGEIIAVAQEMATVPHVSVNVAGSLAIKKATEKLSEKLMDLIAKKWVEDTSGTNRIRMVVNGVKDNKSLSAFINVLSNQVRGVQQVNQQKMAQGSAVLDVMLAGETRALATELEAKDFGGEIKIEVEQVTPNAITIKLIK